ncbi:unnamed protein product, partial [Amoebophrya sp. A120]
QEATRRKKQQREELRKAKENKARRGTSGGAATATSTSTATANTTKNTKTASSPLASENPGGQAPVLMSPAYNPAETWWWNKQWARRRELQTGDITPAEANIWHDAGVQPVEDYIKNSSSRLYENLLKNATRGQSDVESTAFGRGGAPGGADRQITTASSSLSPRPAGIKKNKPNIRKQKSKTSILFFDTKGSAGDTIDTGPRRACAVLELGRKENILTSAFFGRVYQAKAYSKGVNYQSVVSTLATRFPGIRYRGLNTSDLFEFFRLAKSEWLGLNQTSIGERCAEEIALGHLLSPNCTAQTRGHPDVPYHKHSDRLVLPATFFQPAAKTQNKYKGTASSTSKKNVLNNVRKSSRDVEPGRTRTTTTARMSTNSVPTSAQSFAETRGHSSTRKSSFVPDSADDPEDFLDDHLLELEFETALTGEKGLLEVMSDAKVQDVVLAENKMKVKNVAENKMKNSDREKQQAEA